MTDFEKLGVFYLGRIFDPAAKKTTEEPLLYEAKDLTTHAVCVGMTGSGKTGLGIGLIEEAAIDGIPSILIDPKGDLGNLLLTFPHLAASDFRPWVDEGEAVRKQMSVDDYAVQTADVWARGLAHWNQDGARIARLKAAVDFAIYTPGSRAGLPLSILSSLDAPPAGFADDAAALRDRVSAAVSGLLALVGVEADPLQSREHILLATVVDREWRAGRNLDLLALIRAVQDPGVDRIGVLPLEAFFPAKDRFALAMRLNNLAAAPGFSAWTEGEPLDVQRLLYTPEGKPRVSILSIAHLSDAERMFFVTVLLNEVLAWTRRQTGTSSLRALLYMDEIFGYFPPTANPPAKAAMLTLLKQARAFGLGIVLATQNPVDLDYRGLSNTGTWFIGRLQTERDKMRVIEGLTSAAAGEGLDRAALDHLLANLGNRVFLMRNVHEDAPVLFESRWCMSYLRGPLSPAQMGTLMAARKSAAPAPLAPPEAPAAAGAEKLLNYGTDPLADPKRYAQHEKDYKAYLAEAFTVDLPSLPAHRLAANPGESEGDFRIRAAQILREKRDEAVAKLREKYAAKLDALVERERRAAAKVENEKAQLSRQRVGTAVHFGAAALSILLGRRVGGLGRATTGIGAMTRAGKEKLDVAQAGETLEAVRRQRAELESEAGQEVARLMESFDPEHLALSSVRIEPRRADTAVQQIALAWVAVPEVSGPLRPAIDA